MDGCRQRKHIQLCTDIINGLWHLHNDMPGSCTLIMGTTAAVEQDSIGWGLALEGYLAWQWQEEHDLYWKTYKTHKSSWKWTTLLITKLMLTAWDMWQHCNAALHESDFNWHEILKDGINQQVSVVYEQGTGQFTQRCSMLVEMTSSTTPLSPSSV